jgi:serine/threonine protein kinase
VLADGAIKLPWAAGERVVQRIALGLAYLHSQQPAPILHRDLKSSNVLIDEAWNAKLAALMTACWRRKAHKRPSA